MSLARSATVVTQTTEAGGLTLKRVVNSEEHKNVSEYQIAAWKAKSPIRNQCVYSNTSLACPTPYHTSEPRPQSAPVRLRLNLHSPDLKKAIHGDSIV